MKVEGSSTWKYSDFSQNTPYLEKRVFSRKPSILTEMEYSGKNGVFWAETSILPKSWAVVPRLQAWKRASHRGRRSRPESHPWHQQFFIAAECEDLKWREINCNHSMKAWLHGHLFDYCLKIRIKGKKGFHAYLYFFYLYNGATAVILLIYK